ncbi:Lecithin-cholesterol_acyltransferase [Hexamita inflata]|uniref:Lecithin-cholesterol acyltransferase n=1 Tax=Hexamita inflata TaxID=28002 RepID=A0AA86QCF5_9EUKA|nr:Lecithin-cholesterol acyltransferase [Hexamita inflata]
MQSSEYNDYNVNYEFIIEQDISQNQKALQPIILIPGLFGSKLQVKNSKTGEIDSAWINPSLQAPTKFSQYLWGEFNDETRQYESFIKDHGRVYAVRGMAGCDHLLDAALLDRKIFDNTALTNYFGQFSNYLVKNFGYELGFNLFAFTYDWRQMMSHPSIQTDLHALVHTVKELTGQKAVIIAHSLGGVLTETYLRLHPGFEEDISKFIALGTPFDGGSGFMPLATLLGYNLQLSIKHCICKGQQTNSGTPPFLSNILNFNGPINKIFLKKLNSSTQQIQVNEPECGFESPKYDLIKFNDEVYGDEIPDVLYVLAKKMVSKKMLKDEFIEETMRNMQRGCKRGAIQLDFDAESPLKQVAQSVSQIIHAKKKPEELIEKDFEANTPTLSDFARKDYAWESFSVWGKSSWHSLGQREYKYLDSKFMRVGGDLQFSPEFYHENKVAGTRRFSEMPELLDFYLAKQYFMEQQHGGPQTEKSCTAQVESAPGPWTSVRSQLDTEDRSLLDLTQYVHTAGTIDRAMYGMSLTPYQEVHDIRRGKIVLKPDTDFRFVSIVGCGSETPLHVVYQKPVDRYEEILSQIPTFVQADGDSTVLTVCALNDPFEDAVVEDKIVLPGVKHSLLVSDPAVFELVAQSLGLGPK